MEQCSRVYLPLGIGNSNVILISNIVFYVCINFFTEETAVAQRHTA